MSKQTFEKHVDLLLLSNSKHSHSKHSQELKGGHMKVQVGLLIQY